MDLPLSAMMVILRRRFIAAWVLENAELIIQTPVTLCVLLIWQQKMKKTALEAEPEFFRR